MCQIKLKEVLREHFGRHQAAGKSTRAIVFTQWRDSVEVGCVTHFVRQQYIRVFSRVLFSKFLASCMSWGGISRPDDNDVPPCLSDFDMEVMRK